jgi:hypothetical protein
MPEGPAPTSASAGAPQAPKIDIEKLAERVYSLLLADARLGRARSDATPTLPSRMGEG